MKFNPLPEIVAGKRLVVVDDSIVRGNTTRQIVQMLRDAGASEVHMRISAPPIRHPCHYGIDMSTREEMIAHGRTEAEIAAELGADSLAYLSLGGVYEAIGGTRDTHCDACFSGDYPLANTGESPSQGRVRAAARAGPDRRRSLAPARRSRRCVPAVPMTPVQECTSRAPEVLVDVGRRVRERRRRPGARDRVPHAAVGHVQPARVDQLDVERALSARGVARQLRLQAVARAAAQPVRAPRQPVPRRGGLDAVGEPRAERRGALERRRRLELAQRRGRGGERERVRIRRPARREARARRRRRRGGAPSSRAGRPSSRTRRSASRRRCSCRARSRRGSRPHARVRPP